MADESALESPARSAGAATVLFAVPVDCEAKCVAWSPAGAALAIGIGNEVGVFDARTAAPMHRLAGWFLALD